MVKKKETEGQGVITEEMKELIRAAVKEEVARQVDVKEIARKLYEMQQVRI